MRLVGEFLRGHTETVILSILNNGDNYGYEISKIIKNASKGIFNITQATLYNALKRLLKEELITNYWKDGLNGTRRKYYAITEKGKLVLEECRRDWHLIRHFLNDLIGGTYER